MIFREAFKKGIKCLENFYNFDFKWPNIFQTVGEKFGKFSHFLFIYLKSDIIWEKIVFSSETPKTENLIFQHFMYHCDTQICLVNK